MELSAAATLCEALTSVGQQGPLAGDTPLNPSVNPDTPGREGQEGGRIPEQQEEASPKNLSKEPSVGKGKSKGKNKGKSPSAAVFGIPAATVSVSPREGDGRERERSPRSSPTRG